MIIAVIVLLVVIIAALMFYNMSIHKKIQSFNNINQKITNLNILQDFMNALGECSSTDEKLEKINNILTVNSNNLTSDFIYHIVMCSNDFCKKLSDENKD